MPDKPLHVQVAEALGCKPAWIASGLGQGIFYCPCPKTPHGQDPDGLSGEYGVDSTIPHYDTDWAATGPLIERYGISLHPGHRIDIESHTEDWLAIHDGSAGHAPTPLIAVCNLILALHKAGKL